MQARPSMRGGPFFIDSPKIDRAFRFVSIAGAAGHVGWHQSVRQEVLSLKGPTYEVINAVTVDDANVL
jgi:hypothetical protein